MPGYTYLECTGGVLHVYPENRDWADYTVEPHIAYHRAVLSTATAPLVVRVDASSVPTSAVLHAATFLELARVVRAEFKGLVGEICITNTSAVVRALYTLLKTSGAIGTDTIGKITLC
jgi:hypothetical protein